MPATKELPVIALDANMLLDMTRLKIHLVEQLETLLGAHTLIVPTQVKHELDTLALKRGKNGAAARVALEFLRQHKVKVVPAHASNGDQALLQFAQKGAIIATNDKALRQTLKNAPQRAIVVRQSKYLAWL